MKLIDYVTSFDTQAGLASRLGVSATQVHHWAHGIRPIPAERCIEIEKATSCMVTCEELIPEIDWGFLRSTKKKAA